VGVEMAWPLAGEDGGVGFDDVDLLPGSPPVATMLGQPVVLLHGRVLAGVTVPSAHL
jgi:hypothetical protein